MRIRKATLEDNITKISQLFFETDRYIYPCFAKEGYENAIKTIEEMVKTKGTIFYYENLIVAEECGEIIGLLAYINEKTDLSNNYNMWCGQNIVQDHAIKNYFLELKKYQKNNQIYVVAIVVDLNHRRKGVATKLLKNVCLKKADLINLDVLKDNVGAINLYKKIGFKIEKEYLGYGGYKVKKPECYYMSRK